MKLVIDIPDETYQALMADTKIRDPNKIIFKAIACGKPVCEVFDPSDIEKIRAARKVGIILDIKTYYKFYRKKPVEEKIDLMLESMHWASINSIKAERYDMCGNENNKRYYRNEEQAMRERARLMRGLILQEIKDLKEES